MQTVALHLHQVRCIVRPRQNPADFLRDWGATTVQADLNDPTSLPAALVGIHTVIDCSTARPEESTQKIDWNGKVALIQCAQVWLPLRCHTALSACIHSFRGRKRIPGTAERQFSDLNLSKLYMLRHTFYCALSVTKQLAMAGVREPSRCNFPYIRNT